MHYISIAKLYTASWTCCRNLIWIAVQYILVTFPLRYWHNGIDEKNIHFRMRYIFQCWTSPLFKPFSKFINWEITNDKSLYLAHFKWSLFVQSKRSFEKSFYKIDGYRTSFRVRSLMKVPLFQKIIHLNRIYFALHNCCKTVVVFKNVCCNIHLFDW